MGRAGQRLARGLAEGLAGGIEQDDDRVGAAERCQRAGDRLGAEDHPGAAAVRRVVDAAVAADPPGPQVVDPDGGEPLLLDPARDAGRERARDHLGEEGDELDLEGHRSALRSVAGRAGGRRAPVRGAGSGRARRRRHGRAPPGGPPRSRRTRRRRRLDLVGRGRSSASGSATIRRSAARGSRTNGRTIGRSKSPRGPADHLEHLGAAGPVDVAHGAQLGARRGRGPRRR